MAPAVHRRGVGVNGTPRTTSRRRRRPPDESNRAEVPEATRSWTGPAPRSSMRCRPVGRAPGRASDRNGERGASRDTRRLRHRAACAARASRYLRTRGRAASTKYYASSRHLVEDAHLIRDASRTRESRVRPVRSGRARSHGCSRATFGSRVRSCDRGGEHSVLPLRPLAKRRRPGRRGTRVAPAGVFRLLPSGQISTTGCSTQVAESIRWATAERGRRSAARASRPGASRAASTTRRTLHGAAQLGCADLIERPGFVSHAEALPS